MALFLERGFEATTLDDIAAAADISRRSFFHYFASKEDVVFAWQEETTAALVAAVAARPANESMLAAAESAISAMARELDSGRSHRDRATEAATIRRCRRAIRSNMSSSSARWRRRLASVRPQSGHASGAPGRHDRNRGDADRRRDLGRRRRARKAGGTGEADIRGDTDDPQMIARIRINPIIP